MQRLRGLRVEMRQTQGTQVARLNADEFNNSFFDEFLDADPRTHFPVF